MLVSSGVGAFVALFLIVFRPFDTDGSSIPNLNFFLAGYGVVITLILLFAGLLIPRISPRIFSEERWTVGRQLLYMFGVVWLGITASYFYLLSGGGEVVLVEYLYFSRNALLVAAFPVIVLTLLDYIRKLRHYERGARAANLTQRQTAAPAHATITLTDDQDRPGLTIDANQIWCLHSDGNYVEVWHVAEDGGYARHLIRNTLASLSDQLPADRFLTCHRSWVVNPLLVEEVTGNAQGYRLHRAGAPVVAVARGRSKRVLERLAVGV